jgi:hypothetical protein
VEYNGLEMTFVTNVSIKSNSPAKISSLYKAISPDCHLFPTSPHGFSNPCASGNFASARISLVFPSANALTCIPARVSVIVQYKINSASEFLRSAVFFTLHVKVTAPQI